MKKLLNILLILLLSCTVSTTVLAQNDSYLYKAMTQYRLAKDSEIKNVYLEKSSAYLDSAIHVDAEKNNPKVWYLRGYVNLKLFNERDGKSVESLALEKSLSSFEALLSIEGNDMQVDDAKSRIKYIVSVYYNAAVNNLREKQDVESLSYFEKFRSTSEKVFGKDEFKSNILGYYNSLAAYYGEKNEIDSTGLYYAKSEEILLKMLQLDPNNYLGTYNLGIHYYNAGVKLILGLPPETPLDRMLSVQEEARQLFLKAKPYLEKARDMNPEAIEIVEGLKGVSIQLNDHKIIKYYSELLINMKGKAKKE